MPYYPPLILLGACGDELTQTADRLTDTVSAIAETAKPLRLQTIEELENLSASDIPGDFAGFEIEEISWQCTDTVEFSRLLFDIDAILISPTQQKHTVRFAAEVGPDLVSVEYYPSVEFLPAGMFLTSAFYPKVERYRNYSDGSRIGPDEFYDFGHPVYSWRSHMSYSGNEDVSFPNLFVGLMDYGYSDCLYTNDGNTEIYEDHFYYNLNAKALGPNGNIYSGEDFFPIYPEYHWSSEGFCDDRTQICIGNYFNQNCVEGFPDYITSKLYDMEDPEYSEAMSLCSSVPDLSPCAYPSDINYQGSGWYFALVIDVVSHDWSYLSKFLYSVENTALKRLSLGIEYYLQYLVIDGRIIHFDDVAVDNYERIRNIKTIPEVSKTTDGYCVTSSRTFHLYGQEFEHRSNTFIHGVEGPAVEYDCINYYGWLYGQDRDELNNITRTTESDISIESKHIRKDGKNIVIDRNLPKSLNKVKPCRTPKKANK